MYEAKVLADSLSPDGVRLVTCQVEYPHAIHKDIMTHRSFSRNFQSFRAFPPEKVIEKIQVDPFMPEAFNTRVPGMGEGDSLIDQSVARDYWERHVKESINVARVMIGLNLAKAQVNFVLQDLTSIVGIISATEWENFFGLRLAINPETGKPFARPEVYKIAKMMKDAIDDSEPQSLRYGEWHLPLVSMTEMYEDTEEPQEINWNAWKKVSTGRCARVSYLTHDGQRDMLKDIELHDSLMGNGHLSPFEHIATPSSYGPFGGSANFRGWEQYRAAIPNEDNYSKAASPWDE